MTILPQTIYISYDCQVGYKVIVISNAKLKK